jgi:hypothetical protein
MYNAFVETAAPASDEEIVTKAKSGNREALEGRQHGGNAALPRWLAMAGFYSR